MRRVFRPFAIACAAALSLTACKKDAKEATQDVVSADALSAIQRMGFSTEGVKKVNGGYLVEGDINLSDAELASHPASQNFIIAKEEQYRTFNTVKFSTRRTITVKLNNTSGVAQNSFSAALDETISRYNAENLQLFFVRNDVASSPNITIVAYYENSNTLGSSGFPNS